VTPFTLGTAGPVTTTSSPSVDGPPQRSSGVLVADDDEAVRRMLAVGMRTHGFAVWLAANGREAVELYREHADGIDVVLLDVRMPGLAGPGTLAALQEIDPRVRCCFMTGDAGYYSDRMLVELGAAAVFRKPFRLREVAQRLRRLTVTIDHYIASREDYWDDDGGGSAATRTQSRRSGATQDATLGGDL
jgi:DNA-binding NtrC family response regulator